MPKPPSKNWLYLLLYTPSAIVLMLHAYIGFYRRFISDDYCEAFYSRNLGPLRNVWYWYHNLGGRYSEFAGNYVLALSGTKGSTWLPLLTLILWTAIIAAIILSIRPQTTKIKIGQAIGLGIVLLATLLMLAPNIRQSFYWWAGFGSHTLSLIAFSLNLAMYQWIRLLPASKKNVLLPAALAFILAFISGGFSETLTAMQIVFLILWMFWLFLRKELNFRKPGPVYLAVGLIGALASLATVLLAPGNGVRKSYFAQTTDLFGILKISLAGYSEFIGRIFAAPEQLLGLLGIFLLMIWFGSQNPSERKIKIWEPILILLSGLLLLPFISFAPGAYGLSEIVPPRAQIITAFFLLLPTLVAGFLFGSHRPANGEHIRLLAVAALLMAVSAGINAKNIFDTRQEFIDYAQAWDKNEQIIFDAIQVDEQTAYIIPIDGNWAGLNEPNNNPRFYVNYCMSKYYGINILAPEVNP